MNELSVDVNSLEAHIDDPIKKVVVGLALLGFKPAMSCCGFSYKGEKVKKTHLGKAYVYLFAPAMQIEQKGLLIDLSRESQWMIGGKGKDAAFIDFYASTWDFNHPWAKKDAVHEYEIHALNINSLERVIEARKDQFKASAIIEDGNLIYQNMFNIRYWQYEPAQPWLVTPETFNTI